MSTPYKEMKIPKLGELKVGDKVTRMLAGIVPHKLEVTEVTETEYHYGAWVFDKETGMEIDEDCFSGPKFGLCISFIKKDE